MLSRRCKYTLFKDDLVREREAWRFVLNHGDCKKCALWQSFGSGKSPGQAERQRPVASILTFSIYLTLPHSGRDSRCNLWVEVLGSQVVAGTRTTIGLKFKAAGTPDGVKSGSRFSSVQVAVQGQVRALPGLGREENSRKGTRSPTRVSIYSPKQSQPRPTHAGQRPLVRSG